MIYLIKKDTGEKVVFISEEGAAKTLAAFPKKYQGCEIAKPEEKKKSANGKKVEVIEEQLTEEDPSGLEDEKD